MSNSIPEKPDLKTSPSMTDDEKLQVLTEHFQTLNFQNKRMMRKLAQMQQEKSNMKEKMERLTRRNDALQSPSLYLATIQELITEGENSPAIVLKQHGNNQEILTDISEKQLEHLEAGDRITVDDSYTVQGLLDADTDSRAQAMEVDKKPEVTYEDIGGLEKELREVREAVERPLKENNTFKEVGIVPPSGVLLYGPPGTGKTMLAKAVARETNATFIRLAGSELVRKFIGEGARLVRDLFELAEENAPAIIFIDEIDAIASKRTISKTSGDQEVQRTLMQLLSSMDGFDDRGDIRVMAATNRFDMLDDAILRPGRFDRRVEVGLPNTEARGEIFRIHTRKMDIDDDIDFTELAEATEGFTGADISHTATEAGMSAVRDERSYVTREDFDKAVTRVRKDVDDDSGREIRYAY